VTWSIIVECHSKLTQWGHSKRLIADTACRTRPMLVWLVDCNIPSNIPVLDKSGHSDGSWRRADFEWEAENDQYICAKCHEMKQFSRNYSDPNPGSAGQGGAKYRGIKLTCQTCYTKPS
jgi:hypothetical protein